MGKLFAAKRNALPSSDFALPKEREYPINDKGHGIQAIRMKGHASPAQQEEIVSKVKAKFPGVGKSDKPKGLAARLTGK